MVLNGRNDSATGLYYNYFHGGKIIQIKQEQKYTFVCSIMMVLSKYFQLNNKTHIYYFYLFHFHSFYAVWYLPKTHILTIRNISYACILYVCSLIYIFHWSPWFIVDVWDFPSRPLFIRDIIYHTFFLFKTSPKKLVSLCRSHFMGKRYKIFSFHIYNYASENWK